jgi:hypothetical protein
MIRKAYLLLATVMGIGGIFTMWATSLTTQTLTEEANRTQEFCGAAMFSIYSGSYDRSSNNLYIVLKNQRSVDLVLENLYLFYPNNVLKTIPLNEPLKGGVMRPIDLTVEDGFTKGLIKTNCPEVSVEFTYSGVAGIRVPLQIPFIREIKRMFRIES